MVNFFVSRLMFIQHMTKKLSLFKINKRINPFKKTLSYRVEQKFATFPVFIFQSPVQCSFYVFIKHEMLVKKDMHTDKDKAP